MEELLEDFIRKGLQEPIGSASLVGEPIMHGTTELKLMRCAGGNKLIKTAIYNSVRVLSTQEDETMYQP
jgi:hypothetical protein